MEPSSVILAGLRNSEGTPTSTTGSGERSARRASVIDAAIVECDDGRRINPAKRLMTQYRNVVLSWAFDSAPKYPCGKQLASAGALRQRWGKSTACNEN